MTMIEKEAFVAIKEKSMKAIFERRFEKYFSTDLLTCYCAELVRRLIESRQTTST